MNDSEMIHGVNAYCSFTLLSHSVYHKYARANYCILLTNYNI